MLDHLLDFFRGLLGFLCQVTHLVGHHGKTTALFTRAGRLDGGVERQQVGLLGNRADGDKDGVDVFAVTGQILHHADRTADFLGQGADRMGRIAHDGQALVGRLVRIAGGLGRMGGVARHVLGSGGHLVYGGGHQVDLGHLLVHALIGADGDVGGVLRGVADLLHRGHHLADHRLQLAQEGIEAFGDRAQFIGAVAAQAAGQVAFALGNVVEHGHHLP
ncbi:hypothetical protein D3C81_1421250 [compost metagenome]